MIYLDVSLSQRYIAMAIAIIVMNLRCICIAAAKISQEGYIGEIWNGSSDILLNYKQLLDEVFVITGIIKVEVSVTQQH